jgi:Protein of unknown function (DUF3828)
VARILPALVVALALMATATIARADDGADAKAFVEAIYGRYVDGASITEDWNIEPYDSAMRALMDEDRRLTPEGEVGVLDWDPICQCQDFSKLRATVTVRVSSPTAAVATIAFKDIGWSDQTMRHATFDLVKENGEWRIHDIRSKDFDNPTHSMRARFIEANAERRRQ